MKKIVDWTFGSVFRTFGRIIAYLIFGIAISYILHSLDFRITDLFLDNVKADNIYRDGFDTPWYTNSNRNTELARNDWYNYRSTTSVADSNDAFKTLDFYTKTGGIPITNIRGGLFTIPFYVSAPILSTSSTSQVGDTVLCRRFTCNNYNSSGNCDRWRCDEFYTSQSQYDIYDKEYLSPVIEMNAFAVYDTGYLDTCSVDMNKKEIQCPVATYTNLNYVSFIRVQVRVYYFANFNTASVAVGLYRKANRYNNGSQAIIDQQNRNTQSIIQQQQNSTQQILDSNTTQAEEDAQGFFDDFDVPDVGGLSAIITAPLNTIRSLLSSSCSELVLPLPYVDEDLRLPCMNSIYTEHFGLFFSLYQTIILAIIAYRCIRSIYFDITGFTNPDDDRIEVMDL